MRRIRKYIIIIIVFLAAIPAVAQVRALGIGIKGGVNMPEYHYSSGDLNVLAKDSVFYHRLRPIFGLQVEIPVDDYLYVSPEVMFLSRGDRRIFYNFPTHQNMTYTAVVNYLDLRVPVAYVFPVSKFFQPYLFAGPDVGMVFPYIEKLPINLSGLFEITGASAEEVNKSNMAQYDVSAFGGVGFRFNIDLGRFSLVAKLEAAYNYGLLNTYSQAEMDSQVPAANLGSGGTHYSLGKRYNRGMEATFSLVLPLKFQKGDACSNWSKEVYPSRSKGHRGF